MRLESCRAGFAGAALALGVLWFAGSVGAQGRASLVEVDAVTREPLSQTMPVIGRFVARQSGPVAALVAGPVETVLVDVGDRVAAGDPVVRLSTAVTAGLLNLRAAELQEKEAALGSAKAQLRLAKQELARLESLKKSAAFSQASYDDKRAQVAGFESRAAEAEAALVRAQANLELAGLDMARAEIRAPYNGVVVTRHVAPGAYVNTGAPVISLVNDEDMEIEADVPSTRLSGLTPDREVEATLEGGARMSAAVRSIIPTENALTRTRPVRFTPNIDGGVGRHLATDQSVTLFLPVGEPREAVTVHKDAVIARGGGDIVFVVIDGKVELRRVTLGEASGVRLEVVSGLAPGDIVVTRGNERLRSGQEVTYKGRPPGDG